MTLILAVALVLAAFRLWSWAGLGALVPFGFTAILARIGSGPGRPDYRPTLGIAAAGTLLIPFVIAIAINYAIWGYFLDRPGLDRRIVEAVRVETITHVEMLPAHDGKLTFLGTPVEHVEPYIATDPKGNDYHVLEGRILRALMESRVLDPAGDGYLLDGQFYPIGKEPGPQPAPELAPPMPAERLQTAYRLLEDSGRLEEGIPGYHDAKKLRGILIEAIGRDGRRLLFAGVSGGEVANDRYPYYEFLFADDPAGGPPRLLSFQRFYYDIAGMEGIEWPVFFVILAYLLFFPTILVQTIVAFVVWRVRRRKARAADADGGQDGNDRHHPGKADPLIRTG